MITQEQKSKKKHSDNVSNDESQSSKPRKRKVPVSEKNGEDTHDDGAVAKRANTTKSNK